MKPVCAFHARERIGVWVSNYFNGFYPSCNLSWGYIRIGGKG